MNPCVRENSADPWEFLFVVQRVFNFGLYYSKLKRGLKTYNKLHEIYKKSLIDPLRAYSFDGRNSIWRWIVSS